MGEPPAIWGGLGRTSDLSEWNWQTSDLLGLVERDDPLHGLGQLGLDLPVHVSDLVLEPVHLVVHIETSHGEGHVDCHLSKLQFQLDISLEGL